MTHLFPRASSLAALLCVFLLTAVAAADASDAADLNLRVQYGVALALAGRTEEAQTTFLSVLTDVPEHAGALNNIGNLHLMRGEASVALAFYGKAAEADPVDAGIALNRAVAFMIVGDAVKAEGEAANALRMAGGMEEARTLLGMPNKDAADEREKAADVAVLTQEEIQALLDAAAASVPVDTTAALGDSALADSTAAQAGPAQPTVWRSAGLRAHDLSELVTTLYWNQ